MFGYIKPHVPELKVKEYELYRAFYCGLCRTMNRTTTCLSTLTLSYDFVFLALIRAALTEDDLQVGQGRCVAHPFRKRSYIGQNGTLAYCATAAAVLTRGKVRDDIADSKGIAKAKGYLLLPAANAMVKKASPPPPLTEYAEDKLRALSEMEERQMSGTSPYSADEGAALFGELLGEICAFGLSGAARRIAAEIGLHTGRFIYLLDAADDIEDDRKKGNYNPFSADNALDRDRFRVALQMELHGLGQAVSLMEFRDPALKNIVENIVGYGMPRALERVIAGEKEKKKKQEESVKI